MLTKADFQQAIRDSIANYPALAPLYNAKDPRILQHLEAMATMLSMLSSQIEVAMTEPFEKVRDATVLADAAMRGIIPKATPARVAIELTNKGQASISIDSGRVVFDSVGRPYIIDTPAIVTAGETATVEAVQVSRSKLTHTVTDSVPFYPIAVPESEGGDYLSGVAVDDMHGEYEYRDRYINTWPDERVFHIEADDRQRIYVRFGQLGVVGVQPADGAVITLTISRTFGAISVAFDAPFSLEYLLTPNEAALELRMKELIAPGQNPIDKATLRELARYPAVYTSNAVFLGEFDFLVRKEFPTLKFLSVWNESAEEQVRGASLDNINALFVACLSDDESEAVIIEGETPAQPDELAFSNLTATQQQIYDAIKQADDSYKIRFFTPIKSKIYLSINAVVSSSYVARVVRDQIAEVLLAEYGESASAAKRSLNKPLYQQIYALLKQRVPALSAGMADMTVNIAEPAGGYRPELWRYVDQDSMTISVETANITVPSWGR